MSSKVSASPSTAQTAITRMSSSRCSTFHPQRGSSIDANSVIRASSMAFPSLGKGRALARQRAGIEPADLVRSPWGAHEPGVEQEPHPAEPPPEQAQQEAGARQLAALGASPDKAQHQRHPPG